jgi:hypothetical protein
MMRLPVGILVAFILIANATVASAATLWDYIVFLDPLPAEIGQDGRLAISGTVFDHASRPVQGAEIKIRFLDKTASLVSDSEGRFGHEFEADMQGIFSVSIYAKLDGKKGFATKTVRIGDDAQGIYYESSRYETPNDPYGALKQKHYQKFVDEQNAKKQKQLDAESKKLELQQKRNQAQQKIELEIKNKTIGDGVFGGYDYDRYVAGLDPRVKGTIVHQLNHTKTMYAEAKHAMETAIQNGTSAQDAKKIYLQKLAAPQQKLSDLGKANAENHSEIKKHDAKPAKKVKGLSLNKYMELQAKRNQQKTNTSQ